MTSTARILTIVLLAGSCVGTDVGNPPGDDRRITASLEFATYVPTEPDPGAIVVNGDIDVEDVWFSVAEILVTPADDCRRPAARTVRGPFVVNLLDGVVYPEPPILADEPGEICEIELTFAPPTDLPDEAPAELDGLAVWVEASGPSGAYSIALTKERRLKYDAVQFVIDGDDGAELRFVNAFDPTNWFADLPGGAGVDDGPGQALAAQFWTAVRQGSRVTRDQNDNRAVERAEFEMPVGVPADP